MVIRLIAGAFGLFGLLGAVADVGSTPQQEPCLATGSCRTPEVEEEEQDKVGLLQRRVDRHEHGTEHRVVLEEGQPFREPPVVRSPVTLRLSTVEICAPPALQKGWTKECWRTRAYATDKVWSGIPGPTIRVKAGETLKVNHVNELVNPDPGCDMMNPGICHANVTNLHTHGLHIGALPGADDVLTEIDPKKSTKYNLKVIPEHMAGTHWYHPHWHHSASIQTGDGAHGALIVDDEPGTLPKEIENMEEKVMVFSLIDGTLTSKTLGIYGMPMLEKMARGGLWKDQKGKYVHYDDVVMIVNGVYKPMMTVQSGKWYRLRMVYSAVTLIMAMKPAKDYCEMQLLAKDGIYLHTAPRKIHAAYFASGNRVDIAMRCTCPTTSCDTSLVTAAALANDQLFKSDDLEKFENSKSGHRHKADSGAVKGLDQEVVEQTLMTIKITNGGRRGGNDPDLTPFSVKRPCYLVDLRGVKGSKYNQGRLELMNPPDFRIQWANKLSGGKAKGVKFMTMKEKPWAKLQAGQVYTLSVRGPSGKMNDLKGLSIHPFHIHVNPFQIVSLETDDPFYQVGDWHDTVLHRAGNMIIKLQTDQFTGKMIFHCHLLDHEDMGMMGYFQINGREGTWWKGAKNVDKQCFQGVKATGGPSLLSLAQQGAGAQQQPASWVQGEPGASCHVACADLGGCKAGVWPKSHSEMQLALGELASGACRTLRGEATREDHAPSVDAEGACTVLAAEETASRCAVEPPADVSRFCRCTGF